MAGLYGEVVRMRLWIATTSRKRRWEECKMQPSKTERLKEIVAALNEYIAVVSGYDMQETEVLLRMAKLDLQMRIHSVSDHELHALCDALEPAGLVRPDVVKPPPPPEGGWGWSPQYGWGFFPGPGQPEPK